MIRLLSLLTLLFFAWPSIVQAFPYLDAAAKTSAEKDIALSRALNADVELANRPIVKATHQITDYVRDNPGKTSAYIGATLLSGGAVLAPNLPAGIFLGAAGGFIGSMASHDFSINSGKDAASVAVSTALGGLIPAPAKLFFPAALATGVYGMNTHDSDLMWEGGLGAAFSFVPLVKEVRHSFNTGKNITVGGAHFSRSLDDSMLRPPVNSNRPIRPPANSNVIPLPHVVEPIEVNGLQQLAQELSGGARSNKDYRQIYFSAERSRAQGLGSNGTLTMDGGTRTLNTSKTGSGKLVLDSSGNSGSLGVFRQNSEGRWLLSANERVSVKDLGKRPVDLIETTERTLASYQKMKATKNLSIQQQIDHVTGVDQASVRTQLFGTDKKPTADPTRKKEELINLRDSRKLQEQGMKMFQKRPKGQTLELSHNGGSRSAFNRKMNAFQDLGNRGKLVKTTTARDPEVVKKYRRTLLDRVERDFGMSDPIKADNLSRRIKGMDADHLHELQLGGLDHSSMLSMLDKSVNRSVGVQIRHQLAKMPEGTPITKVVEKGTE